MLTGTLKRKSLCAMACAIVAVAVWLAATVALPARALATTVIEYDNDKVSNPVQDNITRLNVNKLEKGSRDYVKGAHMVIIEKETGKVITEWTTDGTTHEVSRTSEDSNHGALNIDTVYILRELEAPEGYAKAADTEFVIHSDNFNTSGEIKSGKDADSEEIRGSGPEQAFVINLYDEAVVETTEERTETRKNNNETGSERTTSNQQTRPSTSTRNNEYGDTGNNTTNNQTTNNRQETVPRQNETTVNDEVTQPTTENRTTTDTQPTYENQITTDTWTTEGTQYTGANEYTVDTQYVNGGSPAPTRGGGSLTQTGDETTNLAAALAGLAGAAILARGFRKRA